MKYSLKQHLLNEGNDIGTVDDESKAKTERVLKKCLGWLLNELDGEWQVSKPMMHEDLQDSYIMKVELTNGSESGEMRMGWKARIDTYYYNRPNEVTPYAWLRVGSSKRDEQMGKYDTLTTTMRRVMKQCLEELTFTNPNLLKNTSQYQKKIPTSNQVAEIKECIKEWCEKQRFGSDPLDIKIDSSGLNGAVRTDYDQSDFYDEDGEDLGGKAEDQEYSFEKSFKEKLKAWRLLGFINKIKIQYASNGGGWCQFWVELNS